jgi:MFS family permease
MFAFSLVWVGQTISLLGSAMTGFALTIWAYQLTGSATALALVGFFHIVPLLVLSPVAGAIVDRSNRKWMMMLSDLAAGLGTVAILLLYATDSLQIWHLYVVAAIEGAFQTFQWPAYSAAISLMVDKKHYARTSAMNELAGNSSGIFAPMLAGAIIGFFNPNGVLIILIIDVITFVAAIGALLIVHIPQPQATAEGQQGRGSLLSESAYGFKYILQRPSLLGLQLVFLMGNFFSNLAYTLMAPMILARTANNSLIFGSVQTAGAVGGLVGGLVISAWGGPKRRVHGVLGGWALSGLLGALVLGLGRAAPLWLVGAFMGSFLIPLVNSSNQAIWQAKVAPDVQGRVFSIRRLIAWFVSPISMLVAGPLADIALEPAMRSETAFSQAWGWLTGVGPGTGMSLVFVFCGVAMAMVGLAGYFIPTVRNAEDLLPDHAAATTD